MCQLTRCKNVIFGMLLAIAASAHAQVVQIEPGAIAGTEEDGIAVFKGIPFASPPIGRDRWRPPQPIRAWTGVRDATRYANDCAQAPFPPDAAPIAGPVSEDCLYLNVWRPIASDRPLPVVVWIHGGGFVNGGSSPSVYSGEAFARSGVVFVSLNYRLGRFGFFAHPGLADEGVGGNFGFLDQIAALKWVQQNIAAFGGDPKQVTVFGESAGGMSVHMLLQSPLARGLFHAAAIQSGGGRDRTLPMPTMAAAASAGQLFAPGMNADQLRAMPTEQVIGDLSLFTMQQAGYSGPMIDGMTVLGDPVSAIEAGLYAKVPVLVGANSADGFPMTDDKQAALATFGADEEKARALYDPQGSAGGLEVNTMVSADEKFIEPARAVAHALAARGHDVFLYRFAHIGVQSGIAMGGAPHASEIPYVFNLPDRRLDAVPSASDRRVAELVHRYWVSFAKNGRPDAEGGLPSWPRAEIADTRVQLLDTFGAKHVADPLTPRLDFVQQRLEGSTGKK